MKRANATATTMAAKELLPAPMAWPMLKGMSVRLGVGATTVPLVPLDGSGYPDPDGRAETLEGRLVEAASVSVAVLLSGGPVDGFVVMTDVNVCVR